MRIRLGLDDCGRDVLIDTRTDRRVALLGQPASGKTTTCRYIARCWQAAGRPVTALCTRGHEYCDYHRTTAAALASQRPAAQSLLIVDNGEALDPAAWPMILQTCSHALLVDSEQKLLSGAAAPSALDLILELDPHARAAQPYSQLALDWPCRRQTVHPARHGSVDQPPHRWAA